MKKEYSVRLRSFISLHPFLTVSRPCIEVTFSFSSIKMAAMEFDEVYEEIRGVLVSLVVLSIEILNDH